MADAGSRLACELSPSQPALLASSMDFSGPSGRFSHHVGLASDDSLNWHPRSVSMVGPLQASIASTMDTPPEDREMPDVAPLLCLESSSARNPLEPSAADDNRSFEASLCWNPYDPVRTRAAKITSVRDMFARYGLDYDARDHAAPLGSQTEHALPKPDVLRIAKPVRMRVRYSCHECHKTFGIGSHCTNCRHHRCASCPRLASRRLKEDIVSPHADARNDGPAVAQDASITQIHPGPLVPGPELRLVDSLIDDDEDVGPIVVESALHSCHKCQTTFSPSTARFCHTCGHSRCAQCPQVRKLSLPTSDANESVSVTKQAGHPPPPPAPSQPRRVCRPTRVRVRWTCSECQTQFNAQTNVCADCLHERCSSCVRDPPRRLRSSKHPSRFVHRRMEAVQSRFRSLLIDDLDLSAGSDLTASEGSATQAEMRPEALASGALVQPL